MTIREKKTIFEEKLPQGIYESSKLTFHGAEGYTVYNCSIPFTWEGKTYIYGRVEKFNVWADSFIRLFEKTGEDSYTAVKDAMPLMLEDPYVSMIQGEFVLGGTHVRKQLGNIDTYYGYFYRGKDLKDLTYFTTGPDYMKDIRLVDMRDGTIGVFSRPRSAEIMEKYGSESLIGFTRIRSLDELSNKVIENAEPIPDLFDRGEWGGCNQAYLLDNGTIGVIGHQSFHDKDANGGDLQVYVNTAFEFDPESFTASPVRIIGTRCCYPAGPAKRSDLVDTSFTSGIVMRDDGKVDLYAGIGDCEEGRICIDYPFSAPLAKGNSL